MATKVKKNPLGRGLDSLIPAVTGNPKTEQKPEVVEKVVEKIVEKVVEKKVETLVKITEIEPNRQQPRKNFNEESLNELAESIKKVGVISPILVQEKDDRYIIIAGERRWRAAKIAGIKEIPVIIREYTDKEIAEISLIENVQREDLNPIEEAMGYKRLIEEFELKQDEVAERVSKSRTAVTNSMRLLKLDERVQQMVIEEKISTGHARALLGIEDVEVQYQVACKVFDEKLSVREVEKLVKSMNAPKKEIKKPEINQVVYDDMSEKLKQIMGTKVSILPKNHEKGKIEIEYYSSDELERIIDLFMSTK